MSDVEGVYHNVPKGLAHLWEALGWKPQVHIYHNTHHGEYGVMMKWVSEGEPVFPGKSVSFTEDKTARIAVVAGDTKDDRYITLGPGDGTFQRWKLTDELLKSIRRDINAKLD